MKAISTGLIRRLYLATVFGTMVGLICLVGLVRFANTGNWMAMSIGFDRLLIGFAIGVSRLRLSWWIHGLLMGSIFGMPASLLLMEVGTGFFFLSMLLSAVYGLVIEFLTSIVFGARR